MAFLHGVHVPHRKNTADREAVRLTDVKSVTIPTQMHIGAPEAPIVKVGDHVDVGTRITEGSARVSAPIYASVSGTVSSISDYRIQSRGGKGLINYRTEKFGKVAATIPIGDNDDIIMIASNGIIIRIFSGDISQFARPAKGVRVMRVAEGERILSVALTEHNEEEVTEKPEEADADAGVVEAEEVSEPETEVTEE